MSLAPSTSALFSNTDAVTKNGTGTWTLSGNGAFTGGTRVNGGTLVVSAPGQVLDFGSPLTLSGGDLVVTGGVQAVDNYDSFRRRHR